MSEVVPRGEYQRFLTQLPEDWSRVPIRQVGTVVGGGTPSRDVDAYWRGAIPWLTPGEVSGNQSKKLGDTVEHISSAGLAGSGAKLLPPRSLMVTTRATLGARAINAVPMTTNQGFKSVVFHDAGDADYYYYLLEKVRPELVRRASGTTFLEISGAEFGSILVPDPSQSEKRCIAQVLDTLDTAILETEAIISKIKSVKQGLLHDLLTRGIDANGELRPPQAEAPHLYKQSPLGWIPKEWQAHQLGAVLHSIDAGWSPSCPEEAPTADEWGVLKVSAVSGGTYNPSESKRLPGELLPDPSLEVHAGDVLLARANGVADLVATTVFVDATPSKLMLSDKTLRLNPVKDKFLPETLARAMQLASTRRQIGGLLNGSSGQRNISQAQIRSLRVPVPPVFEQQEASARVSAIEARIASELEYLCGLSAMKMGLMDDLLTGRVRVTPLLTADKQAQTRSA